VEKLKQLVAKLQSQYKSVELDSRFVLVNAQDPSNVQSKLRDEVLMPVVSELLSKMEGVPKYFNDIIDIFPSLELPKWLPRQELLSILQSKFPLKDVQAELGALVLRRGGYTMEIGDKVVITDPNWFGRAVGCVMNQREIKEDESSGMQMKMEDGVSQESQEGTLSESSLVAQLSSLMKSDEEMTRKVLSFMVDLGVILPIRMQDAPYYLVPARLKRREMKTGGVSNGEWFGVRFSQANECRFLPGLMPQVMSKLHNIASDPRVASLLSEATVHWGFDQLKFELGGLGSVLLEMEDHLAANQIDVIAHVHSSNAGAIDWLSNTIQRVQEAIELSLKDALQVDSVKITRRPLCPVCLSQTKRVPFDKPPSLQFNVFQCQFNHSVPTDDVLKIDKPIDPPDRKQYPYKLSDWSAVQVRKWFASINPIHLFGLERIERNLGRVAVDGNWILECKSEQQLENHGLVERLYRRDLFIEIQKLQGVGLEVRVIG